MTTLAKLGWVLGAMAMLSGCMSDKPNVVASNCDDPNGCGKQVAALHVDAVDILMVIDNSASIAPQAEQLKAELPRLLTAIVNGSDGEMNFPPANSVHVAVTTSDLGGPDGGFCHGVGNDGVFVKPGEVGVTCDVSYPGYLAFEGSAAPLETVNSVACVPLVFSEDPATAVGCGFEQPLEAALKAVWPASDTSLSFVSGGAHGADENQGFLREHSLLVVVVVTDEDDCSTADQDILRMMSPSAEPNDVNVRCVKYKSKLYDLQRYVQHWKALRPNNDNVLFAAIAGIPADLVTEENRSRYDFSDPHSVDAFYDDILDDPRMQEHIIEPDPTTGGIDIVTPSCTLPRIAKEFESQGDHPLLPPRRLVQMAKAFGNDGVLGSLCANDFGATTGRIIHAIGERLSTPGVKH